VWNSILHFLGLCPCCHSHFNLMNILLFGSPLIAFISIKFKCICGFFCRKKQEEETKDSV
jgi:hypothetical protein